MDEAMKKKPRLSSGSTSSVTSRSNDSLEARQRELRAWKRERKRSGLTKSKPSSRNVRVGFESGDDSEWNPSSAEEEVEDDAETPFRTSRQKSVHAKKVTDVMAFAVDLWRKGSLKKATVAQLKSVLRLTNCKVSGRKAELVERVADVMNKSNGVTPSSTLATSTAPTISTPPSTGTNDELTNKKRLSPEAARAARLSARRRRHISSSEDVENADARSTEDRAIRKNDRTAKKKKTNRVFGCDITNSDSYAHRIIGSKEKRSMLRTPRKSTIGRVGLSMSRLRI